jgi:hypothetical protein
MMKRISRITGLALLLCLVVGGNGCILHDVVTDLVAKHEAFADYEQREDSANWNTPYTLEDYGKDLRQALEDIGFTAGEDTIITAGLVAAHYGVTRILPSQTHDWTISGAITVQRVGGGSGTLIDYTDVSMQGALGQKIAAKLNGAGVAVINQALQDLIDNIVAGGDPANDPVLILNDVNGSVVGPSGPPTPTDTLEFDWRAWITVELVIRKKIENMYDFWK